jgi:hypothetical protein
MQDGHTKGVAVHLVILELAPALLRSSKATGARDLPAEAAVFSEAKIRKVDLTGGHAALPEALIVALSAPHKEVGRLDVPAIGHSRK